MVPTYFAQTGHPKFALCQIATRSYWNTPGALCRKLLPPRWGQQPPRELETHQDQLRDCYRWLWRVLYGGGDVNAWWMWWWQCNDCDVGKDGVGNFEDEKFVLKINIRPCFPRSSRSSLGLQYLRKILEKTLLQTFTSSPSPWPFSSSSKLTMLSTVNSFRHAYSKSFWTLWSKRPAGGGSNGLISAILGLERNLKWKEKIFAKKLI